MKARAVNMTWTTPADIRAQVQKLWNTGALLADPDIFPRRLVLKGPTSADLTQHFSEVRKWIAGLDREAKFYRLVWRDVNHRILGANSVPAEAWVDSKDMALGLIGKDREAERFAVLTAMTRQLQPSLLPWLIKRPLRALALADDWPRLLDIVGWLAKNHRPDVYLRQVDIVGVHSKFIESHRAVLGEHFDLILPPEAIDETAVGVGGFCCRYGFRDKPVRVRFRVLDPNLNLFATKSDQDITVSHDTFARLDLQVKRVFITENEINFLVFPAHAQSIVVFGAGYGFEMLAQTQWLHDCDVYYWGDLDTHGFAILDQLRAYFPQTASFLMNRDTLQAHQTHWGVEPKPETRDMKRLTGEETALYDDLRQNRFGRQIRLEQEKIGFEWVRKSLEEL